MPLRFRRSFKIFKGFKINLSKSGFSTSIGGRGHSINLGKKGVRVTTGLPGTGFSYSKLISKPSIDPTPTKPDHQRSNFINNSSEPKQDCLSVAIGLPFRVLADLIRSISNPETRQSTLILIGVLGAICLVSLGVISIIGAVSPSNTPMPALDLNAIKTSAVLTAWAPITQTTLAIPKSSPTLLPTPTPFATLMSLPTFAILPSPVPSPISIPTLASFPTAVYIPPPKSKSPAQACCKHCGSDSQACGDSCISLSKNCHQPPGCACQ